jgi:hypothetical protein
MFYARARLHTNVTLSSISSNSNNANAKGDGVLPPPTFWFVRYECISTNVATTLFSRCTPIDAHNEPVRQ